MTDEALARALTLEITRRDHGFQPGITGAYNDGIVAGLKIALARIEQAAEAADREAAEPAATPVCAPSAAADLDREALRRAFVAVGFDLADDLTPEDGVAAVDALADAYAAALRERP